LQTREEKEMVHNRESFFPVASQRPVPLVDLLKTASFVQRDAWYQMLVGKVHLRRIVESSLEVSSNPEKRGINRCG
jgi:hypothetical protein